MQSHGGAITLGGSSVWATPFVQVARFLPNHRRTFRPYSHPLRLHAAVTEVGVVTQVCFDRKLDLVPPTSTVVFRRVFEDKVLDMRVHWDVGRTPRLIGEEVVPHPSTLIASGSMLLLRTTMLPVVLLPLPTVTLPNFVGTDRWCTQASASRCLGLRLALARAPLPHGRCPTRPGAAAPVMPIVRTGAAAAAAAHLLLLLSVLNVRAGAAAAAYAVFASLPARS